jgi:hypothetical protein
MMSVQKNGPGRTVRSLLLMTAITCLPQLAKADTQVPPSVAALLPAGLQLKTQDWGVFDHEFGKVISGQMGALFPGAVSCDYTIGPEFNLELKGDTGWEASPEQLAMWEQMNAPNFQAEAESMSSMIATHVTDTYGELAIAEPKSEQLPNGHITYVDFTWKCAKNPEGKNVMLEGYAHRGATVLRFRFWANGSSKEAIATAGEIFAKFEKLDLAALYK